MAIWISRGAGDVTRAPVLGCDNGRVRTACGSGRLIVANELRTHEGFDYPGTAGGSDLIDMITRVFLTCLTVFAEPGGYF